MPVDVVLPAVVYHGTLDLYLESFKERLLNRTYWKDGRDFGKGLYTTISIEQAKAWARSAQDKWNNGRPCVLEIEIDPGRATLRSDYRIFTGISREWAEYIYDHRKVPFNKVAVDPCEPHAHIVIGPMADADTGKIVQDGVRLKKDASWFMDRITRNSANRRLDGLELGNQIAFCDERLAPLLRLSGAYLFQGRRWRFYGIGEENERI